MREVDAAIDVLYATKGKPSDVRLLTSMMISNVIYGIVFAKRFHYKDEKLQEIIENLDKIFQGGGALSLEGMLPNFLLKLLNKEAYDRVQNRLRTITWIKEHIYGEISNHESTFDNENIRDFIDLYLQAKIQHSDETIFNKGNMFRVIMELFVAGSETTSNTINWCILYMQEYPDIQKKCQDEIFEKCGDKVVTWAERGSLPYIEATLLEIQRMANIAPVSVPHTSDVDVTLGGYFIPRRTLIIANLYSSNMDPRHWDQPEIFNPERFIEGGKLKKNPALIPFSIGPRICLGESLARMEMFLIFTNLLQRFTFCREDDNVKHTFENILDQTTNAPKPYKTRAVKRA
ncbi:cytochrome P450 2J4-like isoform X2 [Mercenaria mercenaria]|nr:cytochrome P450 2J4-like isoform X2 [Mercenaria mercenaria]